MNLLRPFVLFAAISANVFGDVHIEVVNVTCEYIIEDSCLIIADGPSNAPSNINLLDADVSKDALDSITIIGHYEVMPLNLFQLFPKLEKLTIQTRLEAITKENLIGGNRLKELKLGTNRISTINVHTFDGMDKLVVIELHGNKLTRVESNTFSGAINLIELDLSLNQIDTIEDSAFNIPTLEEINLSFNKLQTLTDDVFLGCHELKILFLSNNVLTRIGKSIDNIPKLSMLMFSNTHSSKIIDLDFYAIARKPHLEIFFSGGVKVTLDDPASSADDNYAAMHLNVAENDLTHPDILRRLRNFRNLKKLELGYNNFTTIDDIEKILEMFPKLRKLDVSGIPCEDEVIKRLQTKFGDKIEVPYSGYATFK